ncbi:FtsK/SpoIIIE domain-containing protein [Arthrobacter sp. HY1533]|uniref:FtsK/SpoIIIE domain-containing protein n=1 Tax=Arthrobacter sp. HY1533 TaxID=2970919 RepID=UPI0022B9FD50|nr:FtsK/SpoIIIE domain-containing protein [Arthrobacter sp. HY1533]
MLLEITVVAGPGLHGAALNQPEPFPLGGFGTVAAGTHGDGLGLVELTVTWPEAAAATCSGKSLATALHTLWPGRTFTVADAPLESLRAGVAPLVHGAVVVAWPGERASSGLAAVPAAVSAAGSTVGNVGAAAVLAVSAGPGAGAVFALHRGEYSLGRGRCRIQLADPSLSRHHGTLTVGAQTVTLSPAPGASGFTVRPAGRWSPAGPVHSRGTVALAEGTTIGCGSSLLELRFPGLPGEAPDGRNGTDSGPPGTFMLDPAALEALVVAKPSGPAGGRWALAMAGALPLMVGIGLAVATGSLMFLAFSAMGAVTWLAPLLGGSRRRKSFRAAVLRAVAQDVARQAKAFPDAAALVMDSPLATAPPRMAGSPRASAGLALRLGTATQPAHVTVSPEDPSFAVPAIPALPLCVSLESGPVVVSGPAGAVLHMIHFVLMQLDAAGVPVVVLGPAGRIPLSARFLPHTVLAATAGAAGQALSNFCGDTGSPSPAAVLVSLDTPAPTLPAGLSGVRQLHFSTEGTDRVGSAASHSSVMPAAPSSSPPAAAGPAGHPQPVMAPRPTVWLEAAGNRVVGSSAGRLFVPDGVPARVFDGYARNRGGRESAWRTVGPGAASFPAGSTSPGSGALLPSTVPLAGQCTPEGLEREWALSRCGPLRPVPLGCSATGVTMLDLRRDGPHLLVGGTTGSGKSELLRTLVGSLAAAHSPADLHFVFIDFKGGAGLGVLRGLPHTSSLVTDLGGGGMERTLASLRAELQRREAALARAGAADALEYRTMASARPAENAQLDGARRRDPLLAGEHCAMAHLVVVVDEFRVLVDQFPDAMNELMRIAAVGRSLGMHLVLATQRPQGAVNADIRANITSSICLRVQSAFDSTDVIGTAAAAGIGVSTPGRAFISRAGSAPEEFQSATLRLPAGPSGGLPRVEQAGDRLRALGPEETAAVHGPGPSLVAAAMNGGSGVEGVAAVMHEAWRRINSNGNPGPQAAPAVVAPELPDSTAVGGACRAMEGPGTAGRHAHPQRTEGVVLGMVDVPEQQRVGPLLWQPGVHSHVAFIGTAAETSSAVALLADQLLDGNANDSPGSEPVLLYLLDGDGSLAALAESPWVGSHVSPDQLRTTARLVARLAEASRAASAMLVLCITDWGRWTTALRNSPWHGTEDGIAELVRFGGPLLAVVVGGGRELLGSSFLPSVPNRVFLGHGSNTDSTALWPRLPAFSPMPGRAAIAGPMNAAASGGAGEAMHVAQFGRPVPAGARPHAARPAAAGSAAAGTLRVVPIPSILAMPEMTRTTGASREPTAPGRSLLLGLGGDGRQPVVAAPAPGIVMPVVGSPGSGKSSFLRSMIQLNGGTLLGPTSSLPAGLEPDRPLWLDDAASLSPGLLHAAGQWLESGGAVVAAFNHPGPALSRLPLDWGLRSTQQGIVLRPQRPGDGELLGVRLDTSGDEPPGRAALIDRGRISWFQFPLAAPQESP